MNEKEKILIKLNDCINYNESAVFTFETKDGETVILQFENEELNVIANRILKDLNEEATFLSNSIKIIKLETGSEFFERKLERKMESILKEFKDLESKNRRI